MSNAAKVPLATWARMRPKVYPTALAAHIGARAAAERRSLAEWDRAWQVFLTAPTEGR